MAKRFDNNKMSNDPPKKRQLKGESEQRVGKKKRDETLDHLKVKEPS